MREPSQEARAAVEVERVGVSNGVAHSVRVFHVEVMCVDSEATAAVIAEGWRQRLDAFAAARVAEERERERPVVDAARALVEWMGGDEGCPSAPRHHALWKAVKALSADTEEAKPTTPPVAPREDER